MIKRIALTALWVLTLAWIILCFTLSWQTGEQTGMLSRSIAVFLLKGLSMFGISVDPNTFHLALREFAHFGVFFVLGVLLWCSLEFSWRILSDRKQKRLLYIAALFFLALFSEVPKQWIPGRHLEWDEALLNAVGILCGCGIVWGIFWLCGRFLPKKIQSLKCRQAGEFPAHD